MSGDFPSEVPLCQRISSVIAQFTFDLSAMGGLFGGAWRQNYLRSEVDPNANFFIGLVGFEPTACRRGDRSMAAYRAHLYLARSCSIVRAVLLPIESESSRCGPISTGLRVWLPWTRQRCGGEYARLDLRKNPHSVVRS